MFEKNNTLIHTEAELVLQRDGFLKYLEKTTSGEKLGKRILEQGEYFEQLFDAKLRIYHVFDQIPHTLHAWVMMFWDPRIGQRAFAVFTARDLLDE